MTFLWNFPKRNNDFSCPQFPLFSMCVFRVIKWGLNSGCGMPGLNECGTQSSISICNCFEEWSLLSHFDRLGHHCARPAGSGLLWAHTRFYLVSFSFQFWLVWNTAKAHDKSHSYVVLESRIFKNSFLGTLPNMLVLQNLPNPIL